MNHSYLQPLLKQGRKAPQTAHSLFGHLTEEQLNWKPNPKKWSIAECLDHIIVTNKKYFEELEKIASSKKKDRATFWEKLPIMQKTWGNFIKKAVHPDTPRKVKAFKPFQPSKSNYTCNVLREFEETVNKTMELLEKTTITDHDKMYSTSPAAKFITFKLKDASHILVWHTDRHINQAQIVTETDGFPK